MQFYFIDNQQVENYFHF